MLGAKVRRLLRLLSLEVKACLGGTAQQAKEWCNMLSLVNEGSWPILDLKKP